MASTAEKLSKTLRNNKASNRAKLSKQQKYYDQLVKKGVAKRKSYNIKPLSSV